MPPHGNRRPNALRQPLRWLRRLVLRHAEYPLTYLWRTLMFRTTVIAITGSTGKTTAKECLAAILSSQGATLATHQNENDQLGVPKTIRRIRPWHRFAVVETGAGEPGDLRRTSRLLRPDIAVVLCVKRTHTNRFATLDDTAREKATLLDGLKRGGTVVLNADDPRVAAMAGRAPGRVITFGATRGADVGASDVEASWPRRLAFNMSTDDRRFAVQTRLVGGHWLGSVLGALTAARVCGVATNEAVRAVATVEPFMARMQPVALPGGGVVIRDELNGSPDTLEAMLTVLRESRARRRALVFSDLSDDRASPRRRLRRIGRIAAETCDYALFVGGHAHHALHGALAGGMAPDACAEFVSMADAADWLCEKRRPGDLIFMKGRTTDHLSRVLFAQYGEIGCSKIGCSVRRPCDVCDDLKAGYDLTAALSRPLPDDAGFTPVDVRDEVRNAVRFGS